jgi:hypothetical protein
MEAVAEFVFASGGEVTAGELSRFLSQNPVVETAVLAAAAPARQLKKIVRVLGPPHGLEFVGGADRPPSIVHTLTDAQREQFARAIPTRIAQSLDAVVAVLQHATGATSQRLTLRKATQLLRAQYPTEEAFVKSRSGTLQQFVKSYDPRGARVGVADNELWLVETPRRGSTTTTVSTSSSSEEDDIDEASNPKDLPLVVPAPQTALHALRVVASLVAQLRVFRSPFSPSASVLLREVWRLALRPVARPIRKTTRPPVLSTAPRAESPPRRGDQLRRRHRRRLLVPSGPQGLAWTWVTHGST